MTANFATYREMADEVIASCGPYPTERFAGRGIVICAGGTKYFTCAWVCASMLRRAGCELPIEFWYLGDYELNAEMRGYVAIPMALCAFFPFLYGVANLLRGWFAGAHLTGRLGRRRRRLRRTRRSLRRVSSRSSVATSWKWP